MKLWALSDLHVGYPDNREMFARLTGHGDDWLIIAGDVCESFEDLQSVFEISTARFARVFWVPGNHELWTTTQDGPRGEDRYQRLVALCRRHGVVSPEDPYVLWPGPGGAHLIAPLFLLYDYSFCPDTVPVDRAVAWAQAQGVLCADETYLHPDPHPSRPAWCHARVAQTAPRLERAAAEAPLVLINHFPLRSDVAHVPLYPPFTIWCGTRLTHDWHTRFRASVVVSGHLHMPSTRVIDGVRFEEVSLGYPRQRRQRSSVVETYLRQILPAPGRTE
jgi:predicted phosphodiesterase